MFYLKDEYYENKYKRDPVSQYKRHVRPDYPIDEPKHYADGKQGEHVQGYVLGMPRPPCAYDLRQERYRCKRACDYAKYGD